MRTVFQQQQVGFAVALGEQSTGGGIGGGGFGESLEIGKVLAVCLQGP
jgi:hypothetical protein